jgi:hypothetical protein
MTKNYLNYKEVKKSFARKVIILFSILAVIFVIAVIRFALSGYQFGFINSPPGNEDAYAVAKEFIKPGIKSTHVNFPDSGYQCAQKPDSVYVIKSYVESKNQSGEKSVITYEITMRFNGGNARNKNSWKLLDLTKN